MHKESRLERNEIIGDQNNKKLNEEDSNNVPASDTWLDFDSKE
jgi:hypothetical protein